MNPKQIWRWTRGLTALTLGVTGIAFLAQTSQIRLNLGAAQVGNNHRGQGQFQALSDFPISLSNAYAANGDETLEFDVSEVPFTPDGTKSLDVYQCFLVNPKFKRDVMVTGVEIIPGNRKIVHHAILYKIEPNQAASVLAKDKATQGKGWSCFGGPGLEVDNPQNGTAGGNWLSVWVPGAGDGHFPDGIGNPMPKDSLIVMEVHYNLNNGIGSDQSKVKISIAPEGKQLTAIKSQLQVAPVEIKCPDNIKTPTCTRENTIRENVARAGVLAGSFLPNGILQLCGQTAEQYQKPVGDASNVISTCDQQTRAATTLYSIGGHMHLLAKSIKIELNPDTSSAKTLLHIPKWDYHWQGNYWFRTPVEIKPNDVIRTTCVFDNSVENQPIIGEKATNPKYVMWAEATTDEMCLGIVMASK